MYRQSEEKLVKHQYRLQTFHNMVNFGPLTAEIGWRVWGTPSKFQRVSRLGCVTAATSLTGGQPNLARCLAVSWACALYIHRVSKSVPPLACYNFYTHEWIFIFLAEMLPIK